MAIWNLGSINADFVYSVPHIPQPGETLAATNRAVYLGGKGANMSVAAARAGAKVHHIGAVGADGAWAKERLSDEGIDVAAVMQTETSTGHAVIVVDDGGENAIVLHNGANFEIANADIENSLDASSGDWFVCQNETNLQVETATLAKSRGLKIAYAAAPFDASAVTAMLPLLDFIILNEIEMDQLTAATGKSAETLGVDTVIVTLGAKGADVFSSDEGWKKNHSDAIKVKPIDTTGAGDTFTGYVLAGLDKGLVLNDAVETALRAGALMVTRRGTADVIPSISEVNAFAP